MNTIGWIATLSLFGTISIIIYLSFKQTELVFQRSRDTLIRLQVTPNSSDQRVPWILRVNRIGLFLLPLIGQIIETKRFGAERFIASAQRKLIRAGFGNLVTPIHLLLSTISCLLIGGLTLTLLFVIYFEISVSVVFFGLIIGAIVGAVFPTIMVNHYSTTRISRIEKRLPFAIEFMLLAMEASSSFPAAMKIYCERMSNDPLAEELLTSLEEIESGIGVLPSLTRFAERLDSKPVSAFILALNTGIETGQPIKNILKVQADASRQHRYQSAEEIAKKAGSQALFPLILSMISIMLLLIGPMLLKVFRRGLF
jgi:tight adherence protein C